MFKHKVKLEFGRSVLTGIAMACATVVFAMKLIDVPTWLGVMGGSWSAMFIAKTKEDSTERKKVGNVVVGDTK